MNFKVDKAQVIGGILFGFLGFIGLMAFTIRLMADRSEETPSKSSVERIAFQDGDIIFQTSTSNQSLAIQVATKSKYSHVGIIYDSAGNYFVYEAVQPVKFTPLDIWIKRGTKEHFVVKRLKNHTLTKAEIHKMKKAGERFLGKNYDLYFGWSDDKIYCSELVWKIYKEALDIELSSLQELGEFDLTSDIVKSKMKERYGNKMPLHEKVISPAAIFSSSKLINVN